MPTTNDILWFKHHFANDIRTAIAGTPFSLDLLTAIACQETGYIWRILRRHLGAADVLRLCVGDSLDYNPANSNKSRAKTAFPANRAKLEGVANGSRMFTIARKALVEMANYIPGYSGAVANPNKFCHGFGIFQYDIQFFLTNPNYFLQQSWGDFAKCLALCLGELETKRNRIGYGNLSTLTDLQQCHVAIAYNRGNYDPAKGLKQGHKSEGKYYGENIHDFLRLSQTVQPSPGVSIPTPQPAPAGTTILPEPTPLSATGPIYEVDVRQDPLNLRASPELRNGKPSGAVLHRLPDGTRVQAVGTRKSNGFLEVETSVAGALKRGWAFAKYLVPVTDASPIVVETPIATPPATGVTAVYAPISPGQKVTRADPAGARSLNERDMPKREGSTPADLCTDIADIIDYLDSEKSAHKRYWPGDGKTFCNIYAHDFCCLAGVYLPRVWWSQASIRKLLQGETVAPKVGTTVDEQRANDLFRWLRDWGTTFGWRQTGTLSKLQDAANQGAVGIIVARRVVDGRSGHIVAVVPETDRHRAKRNSAGDVVQPVESQAGAKNHCRVTKPSPWWAGSEFAEHAFWIHA